VYPIALKMAMISRVGGQSDKKMIELLDWMYSRWHFSAPATSLAIQVLSHDPPKDVFKNVGSADRKRALAGVRNAAWDLVYITAWYDRIKTQVQENELIVLCSRDRVLLTAAEVLRGVVQDGIVPAFEKAGFGSSTVCRYGSYVSDLSNPKRALAPFPADFEDYRNKLVADLESEFLAPR
jgi:hypothetical protein